MTTNKQLKDALRDTSALLKSNSFEMVKKPYFCWARQRGPLLDIVSTWVTRHGNFAEAKCELWSPFLAFPPATEEMIDVERLRPTLGGDLSPRSVRESWMWDVQLDAFEETVRTLAAAVRDVGLPWFDQIDSGQALTREAALNSEYWRTVKREDRARLSELIDEAMRAVDAQPKFEFGAKKNTPAQKEPARAEGRYEQVEQEYVSEVDPSLRGTVTSLRKKG
jgi:hypothetical protein